MLPQLVPARVLYVGAGGDSQLDADRVTVLYAQRVVVHHLVAQLVVLALVSGLQAQAAGAEVVTYGGCGVGLERYLLAVGLGLLGIALGLGLAVGRRETAVHLFEVGHFVVQRFQVEASVQVYAALVADGVSGVGAVGQQYAARPVVAGGETRVGANPVGSGQQAEGQLVVQVEGLLVVNGRAEREQAAFHRVLPLGVFVRVQFLVHHAVRLLYLGVRGAGEIHLEVFGQVPAQGEVAVPQEFLGEGHGYSLRAVAGGHATAGACGQGLHVAQLQLVVVAAQVGVEGNALRQPVDVHLFQQLEPG